MNSKPFIFLGTLPLPLPSEGSRMFCNTIHSFPLGKAGMGSVESGLLISSPFRYLICRMGMSRFPHAPADAEVDKEGDEEENAGEEPPGHGCL